MKTDNKTRKAFDKFVADFEAFRSETGETFCTLYEDAFTTRNVANFRLLQNGKLKWIEFDYRADRSQEEEYIHIDNEDVMETIKFWKANLRRARKYWAMDSELLDKIQDGEAEDIEVE